MADEYLSPDNKFIRNNSPANAKLIADKQLFTRAQLEDIGGKLRIAKLARLPTEDMPCAHKFNYYSPGRVQLVDDQGRVFEAYLLPDNTWEVEYGGARYNQRQLAERNAA